MLFEGRWPNPARQLLATLMVLCVVLGVACGGGDDTNPRTITNVTIEPRGSATPRALEATSKGGQPTRTPTAPPVATDEDAATETDESEAATAILTNPRATSTTAPSGGAPTAGRWIDVDVTTYAVRLMDGESVVREIAPVGVGVAIDTGDYISTQTGLFYVHNKSEPLVYDAPFDTYISHWVGFDADKDNGFHSFLKDETGAVVDASTGRVSNGCIRTGEPDAVFAYAEIGMPVLVHW